MEEPRGQAHYEKSRRKAHPVNHLKKKLRSVKRLLDAPGSSNVPPHVRLAQERELVALQIELEANTEAERRNKCISKYHKVRFFERRKAERQLARLRKASGSQEHVRKALIDLLYTFYHPLDVPYTSIFTSQTNERPKIWRIVDELVPPDAEQDPEHCDLDSMRRMGGSALSDLRDGRLRTKYAEAEERKPVAEGLRKSAGAPHARSDTTRNTKHNHEDGMAFFEAAALQ